MNTFFLRDDQSDWDNVTLISSSAGVPVARVGIQINVTKRVRFDVPSDAEQSAFQDLRCVDNILFVGLGESVFVV
jgi:hypothetical protein